MDEKERVNQESYSGEERIKTNIRRNRGLEKKIIGENILIDN